MGPVGLAASFALTLALGQELTVGSKVRDFTLADLEGQVVAFADLKGAVTVVGFLAAKCPVSNAYYQRLTALKSEFSSKGVHFIMVNSNSNETAAELKAQAKHSALAMPVYKDWNNQVADLFGAQTTPEMFLLDTEGLVRYHGAIDDAQNEARVKVRGLRNAIESVLAGRTVEPAQTRAFGCSLHRVRRSL